MKLFKLFLFGIFLAALWSCSDLGEPVADCPGGQAKDCTGECGGTAVEDCTGECGGTNQNCVSFSSEIQPIFNDNCTNCHGTAGGLNLSESSSYVNLVDVTSQNYGPALRIKPNDAVSSVLYDKIINAGTYGGVMPENSTPLSQADIDLIKAWINEGAQDN